MNNNNSNGDNAKDIHNEENFNGKHLGMNE